MGLKLNAFPTILNDMTVQLKKRTAFGSSVFYKKTLAIALPVMAQLLVQNFVSLIDNFMVAGLGDIKMSGVNIAGQINFVFMVFVNTMLIAGGIFIAQYNGAKNHEGMKQAYRFKLVMGLAASILYVILTNTLTSPILSLMVRGNKESTAIVAEGVTYMRAVSWSWIPMAVSMAIGSSLREIGRVKPPLVMSIIATLINTFFNWVLIYGKLGFPRLEVQGAAIATNIARIVEMFLFLLYIKKTNPPFYSRIRDIFKIRLRLFFDILKKSSFILVSEMAWVISETVTTALYNSRGGAEIVSGMAAGFAIANLFFISFSGIHTATSVIIGSTLGANRLDEARDQKNWIINGSGLFGFFAALLGLATIFIIPVVFSNLSPEARLVTKQMVFVLAVFMPAWCYINAQFAVSRTGGDTLMGVVVDLFTSFAIAIPAMFYMALRTPLGPVLMFAIVKSVDFLKIAIAAYWLKKERWVKNLALDN